MAQQSVFQSHSEFKSSGPLREQKTEPGLTLVIIVLEYLLYGWLMQFALSTFVFLTIFNLSLWWNSEYTETQIYFLLLLWD